MNNPEALAHLQSIVKRTLSTMDAALEGKQYLVAGKCTIADLAFVNWDLMLDVALKGDVEAGGNKQRKQKYPNWAAWHERLTERRAVKKMIQDREHAITAKKS